MRLNYNELLNHIRRMNEQSLNSLIFDNLLINNNLNSQYLENNIIINKEQKSDTDAHYRQNIPQ